MYFNYGSIDLRRKWHNYLPRCNDVCFCVTCLACRTPGGFVLLGNYFLVFNIKTNLHIFLDKYCSVKTDIMIQNIVYFALLYISHTELSENILIIVLEMFARKPLNCNSLI